MFSSASQLIGLEISEEFVKLQKDIVEKYQLTDRIKVPTIPTEYTQYPESALWRRVCDQVHFLKVLHTDVCLQQALLHNTDVLIMNNVFEFFMEPAEQAR